MSDYEKLGSFYLGRLHGEGGPSEEPLLYDSKDLCTHAVCVGMTGSGKTGLGVALIEEAAIDGIPALVIDPKGDMANLLLQFPALRPADFEPWVDAGEAARKGRTRAEHAAATAETWRKGLADWDQGGERIQLLLDTADLAVYTPGSATGRPLAVLESFAAPEPAERDRPELLAERAQDAASSLLALLASDADPLRSRESTLLQNILHARWQKGQGVSLPDLIRLVQSPPFQRLGVLELETYYPEKDRAKLAMDLNGLLASPSFARWLAGEPLDVGRLLFTETGKPRVSVLSIAHLSETERMFFVTRLLGEVVSWMRTQGGTSSLRAMLYMDEIFGFFPPTAEPPSKRPMLTLLKQARAYGLGVVLATQNPVDLDYKGLANTGTWFVGRLQTARDKERLIDGLEGATGGGLDRARMDALLSGLGKRVFLLHNVHAGEPVTFQTRWVLSYLRGPMTLDEIRRLLPGEEEPAAEAAAPAPEEPPPAVPAPAPEAPTAPATADPQGAVAEPPIVPSGIEQAFLRGAPGATHYRPALAAVARVHFVDRAADIDAWRALRVLTPLDAAAADVDWSSARIEPADGDWDVQAEPTPGATYAPLPTVLEKAKSYPSFGKALAAHLYREHTLPHWKHAATKLRSAAGEDEGRFLTRVRQGLREERDRCVEALKESYAKKLERLDERVRKAREEVGEQEDQLDEAEATVSARRREFWLGSLLRGKLFSKTTLRSAGTTERAKSKARKEKGDVERAKRELQAIKDERATLAEELARELDQVRAEWSDETIALERDPIRPRKSDLSVDGLRIVWCPQAPPAS